MEFEWDEAKDAANLAKHGVSLAEAARLDWEKGTDVYDLRSDYGEERTVRYSTLAGRLHVCVFTWRGDIRRIISSRRANQREIRDYGKGIADPID